MRRPLQGLTAGAISLVVISLGASSAWAEGDVDWGGGGTDGTVTVRAKDSGGGGKSSSGHSSGGGKSSSSSGSKGNTKSPTTSTKSGTTSVGAGARTSVGNYSSGSPSSAKSSTPEGIVNPNAWHSLGDSGYNIRGGNPFIQAINKAGIAAARATGDDKAAAVGAGNFIGNMLDIGQDAAPQGQNAPQAQQPAAEDPPADEEPEVDPAELAQEAVTKMHLKAPEIGSTPNNPETLGAVGLPVWFWVSNPGTTTTGPAEATAEAGDVEVTATAKFSGLTVRTGDGKTVECSGPGTEYPGTGIEESPDCGHVYEQMSDDQPDGLYTVDITAHWTVEWESNEGDTGTIPIDLDTSKQLRIGQYETVVTDVS